MKTNYFLNSLLFELKKNFGLLESKKELWSEERVKKYHMIDHQEKKN